VTASDQTMTETAANSRPNPADDAPDSELLVKSTHLIYFRMGFALIALAAAALLSWVAFVQEQPAAVFYTAGFVVAYTAVGLLVVKRARPTQTRLLDRLNGSMLVMDLTALSVLVHCTRGVESDLYFLYLLPPMLASHTFGRRGIFATAIGASLAYTTVLFVENFSFIPYLLTADTSAGFAADYSHRLWSRIVTRIAMLSGVSLIWALFCDHMSKVAHQGASRLRGQLDANNRLMAETRAQAAREGMMNAIASAIRSTLDIDQILRTTVVQLISALRASRCAIITPNDQVGQPPLVWQAARAETESEGDAGCSRAFCEFMLASQGEYVRHDDGTMKKTFVYDDPLQEPIFTPVKEELAQLQFRSLLVQPIIYAGDSKGVILIGESEQQRDWSEAEHELIRAVSAQVSIAIEHARLVNMLSRRNRDLLQKNLNLDSKNLELRTMQSQLVHQEKMASLGRMVAGIAHELNNPINFVHGNLPYLREYFEDLKKIIAVVDQLPPDAQMPVQKMKDERKYDFMVTDLDNIIADLAEGAERIRQIIRNLRSFSRLDEAELKEASLQEGIESTIKILSQYYGRDKIKPDCQFQEMPPVVCYPGKLNQVWMNLLSNAAEAVSGLANPQVRIVTKLDGQSVLVSISDNGAGIKPQDQSKIFEPFYTTKPVGQGTGLGLSICHSIIERHGGSIWFETETGTGSGAGTTFKVKIPLCAEPEKTDEAKEVALSRDQGLLR
jgi:signal transduction histidine kinase